MSFARLDALNRSLEALDHALAILRADEATHMAPGGGEKRAEAVAHLAGLYHQEASAPVVGEWIAAAESEDLDADQRAAVGEFKRQYTNLTALPAEFVRRQTETVMRCEQLWRSLRPRGDWEGFRPALEGVVGLMREEAQMRSDALGLTPYDALMEQFDPGNRAGDIAPLFAELETFLTDFLPVALEAQQRRLATHPRRPYAGPYPIERQRALGLALMAGIGFDFDRGSLSVSHHPFCGGVPSDVRITTRYDAAAFLSATMGVLHETGHALYEQGLPQAWSHWPLGRARGMAMHESQSLFVEMQLARSSEFWHWALPLVEEHIGETWTPDEIAGHFLNVEPGLIRVDADEVTYPFHIILRFELEQDLVAGRLEVRDIPEAWDARMRDFLGLSTIDDPANGPMQDVHWPSGAFGYFPSYTLGAMMAAQQWASLERDRPGVRDEIARGDFSGVNSWRAERIWSQGSRYSTPELMARATGEKPEARYFIAHLKRRYGA